MSSIEKRRETLYLPTSFDPSPLAFSLVSHSLTHPSSPRLLGWMWLCFRSLLQGSTHPSVCRCYCSLCIWPCVCVCVRVVLHAGCVCVSVGVTIHVGDLDCWILNSRKCHVFNVKRSQIYESMATNWRRNKTILLWLVLNNKDWRLKMNISVRTDSEFLKFNLLLSPGYNNSSSRCCDSERQKKLSIWSSKN